MIRLNFTGEPEALQGCLGELQKDLEFEQSPSGICVYVSKTEEAGLCLSAGENGYCISYNSITDFCRALCILIDRIKKGESITEIKELRAIDCCGIMLDVSRNAVIRVKTAKDLIKRIARMGLNSLMLYMENIYKIEEYPYFGYMRGAYSRDELKEIAAYGDLFGVEVVPSIQTLAHLSNALRWPFANGMKDTADILLIGEPRTYEFIEAMVRTVADCFTSKKIHIGMDEAFAAGTGEYKWRNGEVDKMEMISGHVEKVMEIIKKYGKEPTMWSDMLCRYGSPVGGFYDPETKIPEELKKRFEGVTIGHWDYYHENFEAYDGMFRAVKNFTGKMSFYGGIWTWGGLSVNYDKTFRTTRPALEACRRNGVREVYAALWGDDGGETSFYTALLGMQLFAEYMYHDEVDNQQLKAMFRACTGYETESFLWLDVDNIPEAEQSKKVLPPTGNAVTVSKQMVYQDVLQGLMDKQYEHVDLKGHYKKIIDRLPSVKVPADLQELFDYHKQLVNVLYLKCDIGIKITEDYRKKDLQALSRDVKELLQLKEEVLEMHKRISALWLKDNKAFGLDRIDLRFGGLMLRIQRAADRIEAYLKGEVSSIEELEEEKLKFSEEEFVHCPFYNYYSTASMQIERQW